MSNEEKIEIYSNSCIIQSKKEIVLKEEADNWGILYNPDTDFSFGINPVSVFIWKQMKIKQTVKELAKKVNESFTNVPEDVEEQVIEFIKKLLKKDLATIESE